MCGIAGYYGEGNQSDLIGMIDSISYRGPDDRGIYINDKLGIAQRRLSIIDLSESGHQPMSNEDGTVWIVFNGEIYNFKELKDELNKTHTFKSSTDTEVIIHLYEELGEKVFEKIHGMFAIAIFDTRNNKLILARDRMGKKPLFWGVHDSTFIFGSELKSLIKHPKFKKNINLDSLNKYLAFEYIPTPNSIFKNTYKLEPGTYLTWDSKEAVVKEFWRQSFSPKEVDFNECLKKIDKYLEQSVNDRMVSDVPFGVFLSGGLDSSIVTYYASKLSKNKIKTFSIGFSDKSFDESGYARQVSKYLNTDHYEKIINPSDCIDLIPEIFNKLDEPIADSSIIPTYLLSKFAREQVTVALGGDGGDELFCGYDTFTAHRLASIYEHIPRAIRNILEKVLNHLPTSFSNMSLDFKIKKFINGFNGEKSYRNQRWLGTFSDTDREKLIKKNVWNGIDNTKVYEDVDNIHKKTDSSDFYDKLIFEYERTYMIDQVLVKVDRASMFNSLEVRAPILDTRVVNFANHLPTNFKIRGLEKKYILKKLMEGKLPKNIIYRKKKGFGMPIGQWIRSDLKFMVDDLLSEKSVLEMNLFNYEYIKSVVDEHMSGKVDNRKKIWTLLVFAMWWRKWVK